VTFGRGTQPLLYRPMVIKKPKSYYQIRSIDCFGSGGYTFLNPQDSEPLRVWRSQCVGQKMQGPARWISSSSDNSDQRD
jgi:hypothetical protein